MNNKKKILIKYMSVPICLIIIGVVLFILSNNIDEKVSSLLIDNNNKLSASTSTLYDCEGGKSLYDNKCYVNATYDPNYCELGSKYMNLCVNKYRYVAIYDGAMNKCPSIGDKLYVKSNDVASVSPRAVKCYEVYGTTGGYKCSKGKYYKIYPGFTNICIYDAKKVTNTTTSGINIGNATASTISDKKYTGSEIKPSFTLTYNSKTLKEGTDYVIEKYEKNINVGTANIVVRGKGNYQYCKYIYFNIVSATDNNKVTISGISSSYKYTGSRIEPTPTVKYGSTTLKKGTDYTLSYIDNKNIGTAYVKVTGKWNYSKIEVTKSFKIEADSSGSGELKPISYDGNKYTVTYIYTGDYSKCQPTDSSSNVKTKSNTATYGSSYSVLKNWWTCDGWVFTGWNEKKDGTGISWTAGSTWKKWGQYGNDLYNHDVTLYAQWKIVAFSVKFDKNDEYATGKMDSVSKIYNTDTYAPKNGFTKSGYKLKSWNTHADGTGTVVGNEGKIPNLTKQDGKVMTLYAQWAPIKYTVTFNKSDKNATGTMNNITKTHGVKLSVPQNGFTKNGYVLKEWNTHADGTGTTVKVSGYIPNLTLIDGNIFTLYAIWIKEDIDIDIKNGKYIIRDVNDTPSDIKKLSKYTSVEVYDNNQKISDNTKFKTGNKLKLGEQQYTIVVLGDTNSDGNVNLKDVLIAYRSQKNSINLTEMEKFAVNTTGNADITISNVTKIYRIYYDNK